MIKLKLLEISDKEKFIEYEKNYKASCGNEKIPFCLNPNNLTFEEFYAQIESLKDEKTCPKGFVPAINFIILNEEDNFVGGINLRLKDNDFILNTAGHIGYGILPQERRKGYASEALRECLFYAKSCKMEHIILTTDPDNFGSQKVIENNGGVLVKRAKDKRIYEIDLDGYSVEESAMAVVICGGKVLSTTEDIYGKIVLSLPKGHIELGEDAKSAAIRECFEETGAVVCKASKTRVLTPFYTRFIDHHNRKVKKTITPVLFILEEEAATEIKEQRIKKIEYLPIDEFIKKCSYENVKNVIREALRYID